MKFTFLGTGAGEGYPGYWCECPHCTYARQHGGKNLRTNSCAAIDEKFMIDVGPACFDNAARFGINLTQVTTLLITHPHEDHLYPQNLYWRNTDEEWLSLSYRDMMSKGGPRFTTIPELNVYGNKTAVELLQRTFDIKKSHRMTLHTIQEGQSFITDGFRVTPVRGNHGPKPGFAHSYVIEKDGKRLLYALDSGMYDEEQLNILKQFCFDVIIMEGTTGLNEQYGGHMCLATNVKMRAYFIEQGCFNKENRFILTHMSPHWCPPHDWYESVVGAEGMILAYDGMEIEI